MRCDRSLKMTCKLGILILLLVLETVVAKQRVPTVPDVSLVSALQHVKRLRQDLFRADQSPRHSEHRTRGMDFRSQWPVPKSRSSHSFNFVRVQGLLSSSYRRPLQFKEATCDWNEESKDCSISMFSMKSLLEKSETEFAKLLLERLTCMQNNYTNCLSGGSCYFNEFSFRCEYMDIRRNHENSPCAKAAPRYFDFLEARTQCRKHDSFELCNSTMNCLWDSDYPGCYGDYHFIFYGIKNFEQKLDQVFDLAYDHVKSEYVAPHPDDDFSWQSTLDYKSKSIECPPGVEQLLCDYTSLWTANIMGLEYYCSKKYESDASKCDADVLCEWRASSSECETDDLHANLPEELSILRVLIPSMPEGTDKRINEAEYTCRTIIESRECKGKCAWSPNIGRGRTREDYIAALLTEPGKNTTDALCTYLKTDGFSYCHNQFSKRKCEKNELCRMIPFYRCLMKEESYLAAASTEDPKLKRRYKRFKKQCWSHTTKEACVESSKVY